MFDQIVERTLVDLVVPGLVLFGSAAVLLHLARRIGGPLLRRHAPARLVGPGGILLDTTGRLGILQMEPDTPPPSHPDGTSAGDDGGGCG